MSVWFAIPSARPAEKANVTLSKWRDRGYKIALWRDSDQDLPICDMYMSGSYPGYARAVNALAQEVLRSDAECDWIVTGGDDTEPDPTHAPGQIAYECSTHFGELNQTFIESPTIALRFDIATGSYSGSRQMARIPHSTFGVMQPTGDRWADGSIDRICGSPWMGREFCERIYGGEGPLWPEFTHMFVDQHLQEVALKLGILWQRRDLTHMHRHCLRTDDNGCDWGRGLEPHLVKWNSQQHWDSARAVFNRLKAQGFAEATR